MNPVENQDKSNANNNRDHRYELLIKEYEIAAARYENIYKAIWQNFYYMGILSAAILTFGSKNLLLSITIIASLLPLSFWYLATYIPMDHYGKLTARRLGEIENDLNNCYLNNTPPKLKIYAEFSERYKNLSQKPKWSVNTAVTCGLLFVISLLFYNGFIVISTTLNEKAKPSMIQIQSEQSKINGRLKIIENKLNSLNKISR
jgi:hypothetical protein